MNPCVSFLRAWWNRATRQEDADTADHAASESRGAERASAKGPSDAAPAAPHTPGNGAPPDEKAYSVDKLGKEDVVNEIEIVGGPLDGGFIRVPHNLGVLVVARDNGTAAIHHRISDTFVFVGSQLIAQETP